MSPSPEAGPGRSCIKCSAPLGVSDQRCPFCGAHQPAAALPLPPAGAPPGPSGPSFQPAVLGLTRHTETSPASRPLVVIKPRREGLGPAALLGASLLLAGGGAGAWFALQRPAPPPVPPPAPVPTLPAVVSSVGGVPVDDADRAEPADLLPRVKRSLASWDPDPQLVELLVTGSRKGAVDLTRPGAQVTFRYAPSKPAARPGAAREGRVVTLSSGVEQPASPTPLGAEKTVPEPTCVWSAAWRSAVKSGLPDDAPVEGRYALSAKGDPRWTLTVPGQPALSREVDGMSCALKAR